MKKLLALVAMCALALPAAAQAATPDSREPEGCQAVNPGQPTCTYTVTHDNDSPVSGIAAIGQWQVTIQVGKKKTIEKSPSSGEPTTVTIAFPEGAKVTAKAISPGAVVIVGHVDP